VRKDSSDFKGLFSFVLNKVVISFNGFTEDTWLQNT